MNTPPPMPPSDIAPSTTPSKASTGKLVGIILGSLLGVVVIGVCIWFFLPKKDPPVVKVTPIIKPDTRLAEYIKGKRFTWLLPEEAVPKELRETAIGQQITSQQVFVQFSTNNLVQYGTMMNGRAVAVESGAYSSEGLVIKLAKDGGTDTAVATKADPGEGDELTVTDALGKEIKLNILKVEPAGPLESATTAMLAGLGLGAAGGTNSLGSLAGLADLLPTTEASSAGKNTGKENGYSQSSSTGRRTEWTFGRTGKDLIKWKGQSTRNVLGVFGNPPDQAKPWGQGGGAWTYNNLNIIDAQGKSHKSVTFFVQNGAVTDIKLPTLPPR